MLWECSYYITPLPKGGDSSDINNYRTMVKVALFTILMDILVYEKILPFIFKFIVPEQHGFVPRKSTQSNLCTYSVDSIYTDFKRAFDVVSIEL